MKSETLQTLNDPLSRYKFDSVSRSASSILTSRKHQANVRVLFAVNHVLFLLHLPLELLSITKAP